MANPYSVPLTLIPFAPNQNQSLSIDLNGTTYRMRLLLNDSDIGGIGVSTWHLDIGDEGGVPIVTGIPIVGQQNLLGQYEYLGIGGGGALFCAGPNITPDPLPPEELGTGWFVYFSPPTNGRSVLNGLSFIPDAYAGPRLNQQAQS